MLSSFTRYLIEASQQSFVIMLPILQTWKPRHGKGERLAGSLISEGWSKDYMEYQL